MGRREEKKQLTREKILGVSQTLFNEQGFEETTADQIAEEAGISRKTLFNYFPSKGDILESLARDWFAHSVFRTQDHWIDPERPILEQFREILESRLQVIQQGRPFLVMVISHTDIFQQHPDGLQEKGGVLFENYHQLLEIFRLAQDRGELRQDIPASELLHVYLQVRNTVISNWLSAPEGSSSGIREEYNRTINLLFEGLQGR